MSGVDWTPVLTLIAGGALTFAGSERAARHQTRRENERWDAQRLAAMQDRSEERAAVISDRRDAFERENLLRAQDAMANLARMHGRSTLNAITHFRQGGTGRSLRDPPEVAEGLRIAGVELLKLESRILDPEVANAVGDVRRDVAMHAMGVTDAYACANDRIAAGIRRLYRLTEP